MKIDYKEIGERITARRKELHMTQQRISNKTGISLNQLSNIENSHSVPTIETIIKLSIALKVTPDYFLLGVGFGKDVENSSVAAIAHKVILCSDKQ